MKEITVAAFLVLAAATPGLAQSYSAGWGTGNVIDMPLLEKTNGAYGYAMSVPPRRCHVGPSQAVQQRLLMRAVT